MPRSNYVRYIIAGDSSRFRTATASAGRSMAAAERRVNRLRAQFRGLSSSILGSIRQMASIRGAVGLVAGTGGLGLLVSRATEASDQLVVLSRQTGFSVERLQTLGRVVEGDGLAMATFTRGLQNFNVRLGEARIGAGTGATAFQRLGLDVNGAALASQSAGELFDTVVDRINESGDAATRTAHFYNLFGRSGRELEQIFRAGTSEVRKQEAAFRRLGIVSTASAETNKALNQTFADLATTVNVALQNAVAAAAPELQNLIGFFQSRAPAAIGTGIEFLTRFLRTIQRISDDAERSTGILRELATVFLVSGVLGRAREISIAFVQMAAHTQSVRRNIIGAEEAARRQLAVLTRQRIEAFQNATIARANLTVHQADFELGKARVRQLRAQGDISKREARSRIAELTRQRYERTRTNIEALEAQKRISQAQRAQRIEHGKLVAQQQAARRVTLASVAGTVALVGNIIGIVAAIGTGIYIMRQWRQSANETTDALRDLIEEEKNLVEGNVRSRLAAAGQAYLTEQRKLIDLRRDLDREQARLGQVDPDNDPYGYLERITDRINRIEADIKESERLILEGGRAMDTLRRRTDEANASLAQTPAAAEAASESLGSSLVAAVGSATEALIRYRGIAARGLSIDRTFIDDINELRNRLLVLDEQLAVAQGEEQARLLEQRDALGDQLNTLVAIQEANRNRLNSDAAVVRTIASGVELLREGHERFHALAQRTRDEQTAAVMTLLETQRHTNALWQVGQSTIAEGVASFLEMQRRAERMRQLTSAIGQSLVNSSGQFAGNMDRASDILKQTLQDIIRAISQFAIISTLQDVAGGRFAPIGFHTGGGFGPGQVIRVGERGPEDIFTGSSGAVRPTHDIGRGQVNLILEPGAIVIQGNNPSYDGRLAAQSFIDQSQQLIDANRLYGDRSRQR